MNGIEYLNELARLRKIATPGPYVQGMQDGRLMPTVRGGASKGILAITAYSNFKERVDNASYIVAACNSVERLTDMLVFLASLASDGDESGDTIERRIQWAYDETRPKE